MLCLCKGWSKRRLYQMLPVYRYSMAEWFVGWNWPKDQLWAPMEVAIKAKPIVPYLGCHLRGSNVDQGLAKHDHPHSSK